MDGNFKTYSYTNSSARIKEILDQPSGQFEEVDNLPERSKLTFTNGYYGLCTAVYVDIRDSSGLTQKHKRPALAKIYRAFTSEMVAVLNSSPTVREVNIVGDCVWAVYNTTSTPQIDELFSVVATANTLVQLLNHHLAKKEYSTIRAGIGVEYGRVLMIKAGFNGSKINDVIYMGDVVNEAAHLANKAARGWSDDILVGGVFQGNLNDHNKGLLTYKYVEGLGVAYAGSFVCSDMAEWVESLS